MHRRTAKIGWSVRSLGSARHLPARRFAWLVALLVATSLADGSLAGVPGTSVVSRGREQVFRLGKLAPTRAG